MRPLEGLRVIDLTHVLAGPFATHQLRCLGAEVVKIERPGHGDVMRALAARPELGGITPGFAALNAGKKSVTLDLKSEGGRADLLRLVATADVFVENFRPGAAARLGLDPDAIRAARPGIVCCSISGWGQSGDMAGLRAYDHVVQAATGMMALQGTDPSGPPIKVGFPVIDIATGMTAASAILAALLRRARGDQADITLDVSMADSAALLMAGTVAQVRASGKPPPRIGNRGFVGSPGADTFATRDGHVSVAANTMGQFRRLCAVLGRPELSAPPHLPDGLPDGAFLADMAGETLRAGLAEAFARAEAAPLEAALIAQGVPAARVRDLHEYLSELYPRMGGIDLPGGGGALGAGWRWLGEAPIEGGPPPRLGEHNAEFLAAPPG
ncbi:MAG: CoA transferase [Rhodobacteraceae bacterium]|nr:CoA transferase [Paracoccaceae bacterium]MBR29265.1 CoA transferase [Paracoccaceae bacterium]